MNLYEHPSAIQKQSMQNNFIYVDQQFENPSAPSNSLTGDSELLETHNFQTTTDNCQTNTIVNNVSDISKWSVVNDPNTGQFTIFTDNGMGANHQGIRLENPNMNPSQLNFNQQFTKFNIPQQEIIQTDLNNFNFASNLILAFPPSNPDENMSLSNNVLTIPQNPQNTFDFINPMAGNGQWINPVPRFQQIDPRSYFVRQVDRNDRINRIQQFDSGDQKYTKPVFSYSCLIALALKNSHSGSLPVNEIYRYMQENFPYFKTAPDGWKNSVRHNLSLNKAFQKNVRSDSMTTQRKGCLWTLKPDKRKSIDKEIKKWFKKHPDAIRKSMTNPDNFLNYFNAEIEDSAEENSRSNSREDLLIERSNSMDVPTTQTNETQSSSLDHLPFYTNGMMNGPLDTNIPAADQFDSQFNSFFGEFCPPSWNTFPAQNNIGRNSTSRPVGNSQINFDIFEEKSPLV